MERIPGQIAFYVTTLKEKKRVFPLPFM